MTEINKKKILIIDDDLGIRRAIKRLLMVEGKYEIEEADGYDIEEKLKQSKPDLVILDIKMPGKSGYEILTDLRINDETRNVKVIGISGIFVEIGASFMVALKADAYFEKPFDNDKLKKSR